RRRSQRPRDLHQLPAQEAGSAGSPAHPHQPPGGIQPPSAPGLSVRRLHLPRLRGTTRRLSLRQRLLGTLVILVVVGFVVSDVASYNALRSFLLGRVDQQLTALDNGLTRGLLVSGRLDRAGLGGVFFQVRDGQGTPVVSGTPNPLNTNQPFTPRLPNP